MILELALALFLSPLFEPSDSLPTPSLVRYCSKECQRAAWPAHKDRCKLGALSAPRNLSADDNAFAAAMTKWLAHWKQTLAAYCIPAMDLPNHGADRLVKYW